ncbi:MAG TPA: hypothetical protein PLR50_08815, partial [Candidatus Rifleibacterium sp.]|nr:hypothetical protein [Candidatus Rifleibacterium sp.]
GGKDIFLKIFARRNFSFFSISNSSHICRLVLQILNSTPLPSLTLHLAHFVLPLLSCLTALISPPASRILYFTPSTWYLKPYT